MTTLTRNRPESGQRALPGEAPFWGFIFADMTVFALFFVAYLWQFGSNRAEFHADATHLVMWLGLANALILLTSSYLVVRAVQDHRSGRDAHRAVGWALAAAGAFAVIKSIEYALEIGAGHTMTSSTFFMYYFVLTGLHLMHVGIGSALLTAWWQRARNGRAVGVRFVECAAGYWHMVDLLWILIFSFVYIGSHA
ncbi:cytochrome c oxidase subunit 3 [Mycolicibacterium austroafricanum]|uniref:cytochrome c oxidase subunit 3 n=1 Tax=Mycolicibacterium austroafricanum TaxID=39687 RepID=UPI001CA31292|nr:cytochrome c oxidase subunit 3 [Mycolicibacterium austroafricanum]QZT59572.1 cytochrome c oxidase subunit 3 [Mycolicibacterium austroafricanum]